MFLLNSYFVLKLNFISIHLETNHLYLTYSLIKHLTRLIRSELVLYLSKTVMYASFKILRDACM